MDCEITTLLQIVHVQRAFCEERQRPIVLYDARAYPSNNPRDFLRLNTTVDDDEGALQQGAWAFVHANVTPSAENADFDLDIMSIKELTTNASHLPILFNGMGVLDYTCNTPDACWMIMKGPLEGDEFELW